jgi:hypothetical protein
MTTRICQNVCKKLSDISCVPGYWDLSLHDQADVTREFQRLLAAGSSKTPKGKTPKGKKGKRNLEKECEVDDDEEEEEEEEDQGDDEREGYSASPVTPVTTCLQVTAQSASPASAAPILPYSVAQPLPMLSYETLTAMARESAHYQSLLVRQMFINAQAGEQQAASGAKVPKAAKAKKAQKKKAKPDEDKDYAPPPSKHKALKLPSNHKA